MKKVIWKYELQITDVQELRMPVDYKILCVQMQNDKPCIWALVNPDDGEKVPVLIKTYGTGHDIEDNSDELDYIGTYQTKEGLVFHVFEYC